MPTHHEDESEGPLAEHTIPSINTFRMDEPDHARNEVTKLVQYMRDEDGDPLAMACAELYAQKQYSKFVATMVVKVLDEKQKDYTAADTGVRLLRQMEILMRDTMIYMGQEDLIITEARESKLQQMFTTTFNAAVKNSGKTVLFMIVITDSLPRKESGGQV